VSTGGAPDAVLSFVDRHIESIEHLEVLLVLAAQEKSFSAAEIFQKIQSSQASVDQRLESLVKAGLLARESDGKFRFAPKDNETRQLVKELAGAYKTRPVRIIEAIYARKTDAVRSFADAFKFRKD
jgi:predicted transcriptional regulator